MTKEETEMLAATSKMTNAMAAVVKEQGRTLQLLVEITGQVIAACPGFSDQQRQDVSVLLAQLRGAQAGFQAEVG